jgi:DNA-binding response OmpR family regulator
MNRNLTDHILLVDATPRVREALGLLFQGHGLAVKTVTNAREAVETARAIRPKIIVLHGLPSALESRALCTAVRNDPVLRKVFLLAAVEPTESFDAVASDIDLTIEKPVDTDLLVSVVYDVFVGRLLAYESDSRSERVIRYLRHAR